MFLDDEDMTTAAPDAGNDEGAMHNDDAASEEGTSEEAPAAPAEGEEAGM